MEKNILKAVVRGTYDIQKLRIMTGNRICANFKSKLGAEPGEPEEKSLSAQELRLLKRLKEEYKLLATGVTTLKNIAEDALISNETELALVEQYINLLANETQHFKNFDKILRGFPIYTEWLTKVKGIGPAMSGVILSEIDIHEAKYPSSIWKYAGLDVAEDGKGRSRRKEHLEEKEYTDKDGKPATKMGITFNPFLKTKLIGVLGSGLLRAGIKNNPYYDIYANYKHRLENHPAHVEKSKGHRHNMATRYMVKMFIIDLHREWRTLEGLEVPKPYAEAKLGLKHAA